MKNLQAFLFFSFLALTSFAQMTVDGDFEFQIDPAKKFSLYIPSSYDENVPNKVMLALHPFNTNRWDGQSWRDTLIVFAETNNLLLVSPDGGIDGQIDSPIDTAFTTTLLDSVRTWYNIDESQKYVMGFSVGGRTTYTYGLRRTSEFAGFMVIGAAANIGQVAGIIQNAKDEKFYLIHGSQDNTGTAFQPFVQGLEGNNACVETNLMNGIGHTIDFPNRNDILSTAFDWLENSVCLSSNQEVLTNDDLLSVYPNPSNGTFRINYKANDIELLGMVDQLGRKISFQESDGQVQLHSTTVGQIILQFKRGTQILNKRITVF